MTSKEILIAGADGHAGGARTGEVARGTFPEAGAERLRLVDRYS